MRRAGFTLVELLVSTAILGAVLAVVLASTAASGALQREERARSSLEDALSLFATVFAREVYPTGYRVSASGTALLALEVSDTGDALEGRYLCEAGMRHLCEGAGSVVQYTYRLKEGVVEWGDGSGYYPALGGEFQVEAFRLAHRRGGSWERSPLTLKVGDGERVQALALYVLASFPSKRSTAFTPGSAVTWPEGLSLDTFGVGGAPLEGARVWAERLVVVPVPNLEVKP